MLDSAAIGQILGKVRDTIDVDRDDVIEVEAEVVSVSESEEENVK